MEIELRKIVSKTRKNASHIFSKVVQDVHENAVETFGIDGDHLLHPAPFQSYVQTKDSDQPLTFTEITRRQDDFDRTAPFTYVLVLRKTHLWDNAEDRKQLVQIHQDILDELSMSGLECVLFLPTKATNNYDNKYGVVFVGIRHASERVIQKFYDRLKVEAQIREGDDLLTPADILEMTHLMIRTVLMCLNDTRIKSLPANYEPPPRSCCGRRRLRCVDMVPYDPQDKDRALVLDFFPLEITDNTMKMELAKRFFQSIADSFRKPLNPMVFLNFCDNVNYYFGHQIAVYFLFMLHTLQFIAYVGIAGLLITVVIMVFGVVERLPQTATRVKYTLEGLFGMLVLLVWFPVWTRMWERIYAVVALRWRIEKKQKLTKQFDFNPDAEYEPYFDKESQSNVRHYSEQKRFWARLIGYPLLIVIAILIFLAFSFVATIFAVMYNLPKCDQCEIMMEYRNRSKFDNETATNGFDPDLPPLSNHPFREWRQWGKDANITYEEFVSGWIQTDQDQTCLRAQHPDQCKEYWPIYPYSIIFGAYPTCWDHNLATIKGPLVPGVLWTAGVGNIVAMLLVKLAMKISSCMLKCENWKTVQQREATFYKRKFFMSWLTLFAFNLIFVFAFIRFGHIIFWEAYRSCEQGKSSWLKILGLDIVGFPPGIWNPANDLIVGEWFGLMFDFLMMNLIAALVPMLFALCKKNQFKKTNRYKLSLSSSAPVDLSPRRSVKILRYSTETESFDQEQMERRRKSVNKIRKPLLRLIKRKRRLRKNNLNIAFETGFVTSMHDERTVEYASRGRQYCRLVRSLRPINIVGKKTPLGKGKVTVKDIMIFMERGSFYKKVDFIDIVFRGAVMAFFSSFLPLMTFVSYVFLFLHVSIQLFQLLFYNRRPNTISRHSQTLLSWAMTNMHDIAMPFVIFYWVTVSWTMLACDDVIVDQADFDKLSLGVYYCSTFNHESIDDLKIEWFLTGIILTPIIIFANRMVKKCIKRSPELVRKHQERCDARRFAQLEAQHLDAHVSKQMKQKLSAIYQLRLTIKTDMFDAVDNLRADPTNNEAKRKLSKYVELAVLVGMDSESVLVQIALSMLNHSSSAENISNTIDDFRAMNMRDKDELSNSDAEDLILAILKLSRECEIMSPSFRRTKSLRFKVSDVVTNLEASKQNNFEDLHRNFHAMYQRVKNESTQGHLTHDTANKLLKFLYFLRRCVKTESQPTENPMNRNCTITSQADEVAKAIDTPGSPLWVLRCKKESQLAVEQKISEQYFSSISYEEDDWEQMTDCEYQLFVQFNCIKPVTSFESQDEQEALLGTCAKNGLNPFAYHLLIPGKPIQLVGALKRGYIQPESAHAPAPLDDTSENSIDTKTLTILWSGLKQIWKIIDRANNLRALREQLQLDYHDHISQERFFKMIYSLMNSETLLHRRFDIAEVSLNAGIYQLFDQIKAIDK